MGGITGVTNGREMVKELRAWVEAGLIPDWTPDTMQDEVLANLFRAIRKHIQDEYTHSSGFGPRY